MEAGRREVAYRIGRNGAVVDDRTREALQGRIRSCFRINSNPDAAMRAVGGFGIVRRVT